MPTAYDHHVRLLLLKVGVFFPLRRPADRTSHVTVTVGKFGKGSQTLNDGVEGPDLDAFICVEEVHDYRCVNLLCIEGKVGLDVGEIGIGALDGRRRGDDGDVFDVGGRQEVCSGTLDGVVEVEGSVGPGKRNFVTPYT